MQFPFSSAGAKVPIVASVITDGEGLRAPRLRMHHFRGSTSLAYALGARLPGQTSSGNSQAAPSTTNAAGKALAKKIDQLQSQVNASLQTDIATTLGQDYFSNVQFLLSKVTLPQAIQSQIEQAQAQFAAVGTAQAQVQQATLQAKANAGS